MAALRTRELQAAMRFAGELNEVETPEPFTTELLDRVLELVPCDAATFWAHDLAGVVSSYVACSAERPTADEDVPWTLSTEDREMLSRQPCRTWRRETGTTTGVSTWSEFMSRHQRERYEVYEQTGIVDHACLLLWHSDIQVWLSFESTGRDFSERDRRLIELLEPHFVARVRAARLRRQLDALTAALEAGDDGSAVLVAPNGEIEFASPAARELLEFYFGVTDDRLPEPLRGSGKGAARRFTVVQNGTRLCVDAVGRDGAFVLREEPSVSLTRRERDVLRCVAAGKTTAETARLLWVTEATVSKHLEHVYRKLGVTSRTAALAKLRVGGDVEGGSAAE